MVVHKISLTTLQRLDSSSLCENLNARAGGDCVVEFCPNPNVYQRIEVLNNEYYRSTV